MALRGSNRKEWYRIGYDRGRERERGEMRISRSKRLETRCCGGGAGAVCGCGGGEGGRESVSPPSQEPPVAVV